MKLIRLSFPQHPRPPQRELRQRSVFDSEGVLIGYVDNVYVDEERNYRFVDITEDLSISYNATLVSLAGLHGLAVLGMELLITGNPELIEAEFQQLVNLADQLELKLAENAGTAERAAVRSQAPTQVAPGFEESVAEYYRRLSRSEK